MKNCHGNTHSEQARMEQIVTEFFAKCLHIILESRTLCDQQFQSYLCSSPSSPSSVRPRDKWFNLALRECPAALENFDLWRESNFEPLVVDVVLVQKPLDSFSSQKGLVRNLSLQERYPNCWSSDQEDLGCDVKREKIMERWIVQYESGKGKGKRRSSNNPLHVLYKKSTVLLRSLYTTTRILPAYKIFRDLNSCSQVQPFTLAHRVSSYVEPFTHKEEAEMEFFKFNPVDTSCGRLCLSVLYRASVSDVISEPLSPMSPQLIHDYVGSPLADRLKRFPSLPVSRGSTSSLPFSRRHSWSFDQYRASPPPETSIPYKKNTNLDEYCPSPNYTPSQSPSPPIQGLKSHQTRDLLGSANAHVKILEDKPANSPAPSKQNLHPSPASKVAKPVEKLSSIGKDKAKESSNNLPPISLSRSCSQSLPDELDEPDFACAFDVEYDIMDPGSRPESFHQKGHLFEPLEPGGFFPIRKSQDAAVGALVHMLKKAPPLRQENSCSINISQVANKTSKAHTMQNADSLKTTADALEELRSYRDMKIMLLQQGDNLPGKEEHGDKSDTLTGDASVI